MNENAKKWVAALRSGKYKQVIGTLQTHAGFCCLGVACDVYEKETGDRLRRGNDGLLVFGNLGDYPQVKKWLGLKGKNGSFDRENSLVRLNDSRLKSFPEIADVIESEPKGLFK